MATLPAPVSGEEKRQALRRVLDSRALGRSEQLRAFLRYVCEAELEGRAHEINEYALGVSVLRRPRGYSPAEDSCVRSRAYELRSKLRTYYEQEAPEDPIRIEIDKGGYVPRFERATQVRAQRNSFLRGSGPPSAEHADARLNSPELQALWQPFLGSDAPLLIAFDVRLFFHSPATGLVVRDYRTNDPAESAHSEPLANFRRRMGTEELLETRDYADFGSVHAAFLLGRLLAGSRRDIGLKHSASLDWQDVWNSNVVFIGKPNLNPIIRSFLEGKDLIMDDEGVIHNARPLEAEQRAYRSAATHGLGEKHALITRVRGPQSGRHLLLLSGAGAELMWALAESVTNPEHVTELMSHLRTAPGQYAETFQIVIQASFQSNVPVKIRYVTHHVLSPS
jgi:hypothetical protein